ncbi:MAG: PilC/PilY family type IV pilus protein [Desulfobulbaceae bacterium]|nr:PilC/PilY family type IV pilus protein [Desulfobulbaceae bacterium]
MLKKWFFAVVLILLAGLLTHDTVGVADDTCVFTVNVSDDAKPNIVLLLDTGAEMEQVTWHAGFDNNTDYTPVAVEVNQFDVIGALPVSATAGYLKLTNLVLPNEFRKNTNIRLNNSAGAIRAKTINSDSFWDAGGSKLYFDTMVTAFNVGETIYNDDGYGKVAAINMGGYNGFYNPYGYAVNVSGSSAYLVKILPDLTLDAVGNGLLADAGTFNTSTKLARWTINGRAITLPTGSDGDGTGHPGSLNTVIHDRAVNFRYSTNYLNWLFFGPYAGNGSDLERESRLYHAKMALITVIKKTANRTEFAMYQFTGGNGATQKQPLKDALATVDAADWQNSTLVSEYWSNIDNMDTNAYSPLAEGLMTVGGYFNSRSSHLDPGSVCQKNFVIVVTSGLSSMDRGDSGGGSPGCQSGAVHPACLAEYDGDTGLGGTVTVLDATDTPPTSYELGKMRVDYSHDGIDNDAANGVDDPGEVSTFAIPMNYQGSTNFDDLAYYMYSNDMSDDVDGFQNIYTYTIGFMGNPETNAFLTNASNNGNGNLNLYDVHHPEYGKYHFEVQDPGQLADKLEDAIASILERTNAFAAPVVPVTRTTSGDRLYMSFFTPKGTGLWEGSVVKFGIGPQNQILDKDGLEATYDNGAIKETATPYWSTIDWAADATSDYPKANGIHNTVRKIYTYLGTNVDLTVAGNAFKDTNGAIVAATLGNPDPSKVTVAEVVNFVRGADAFDANVDGDKTENRPVITADVLHSEPLVYEFLHSTGTFLLDPATVTGTFAAGEILLGSKGGVSTCAATQGVNMAGNPLLYPWSDAATSYTPLTHQSMQTAFVIGEEVVGHTSGAKGTIRAMSDRTMIFFGANDGMLHAVNDVDGTEAWGFIPPDQLSRLQNMILGSGHQYYIDSSPKIYLKDLNGDGFITDVDADGVWEATDDQVILVCGERKGGRSYFALDITDPLTPKYLWRISGTAGPASDDKLSVVAGLGETWAEPQFGKVKTTDADAVGTAVMVVGGGYTSDHSAGKSVLLVNVLTGAVLKTFKTDTVPLSLLVADNSEMDYSFASQAVALDTNSNGFIDKIYVGDTGGQMWRFGKFTDALGAALAFPQVAENVNNWTGQRLFSAGCNEASCSNGIDDNGNGLLNERRAFFYPPTVTLEYGYDLVFMATGDRENPCVGGTHDQVYAVKDNHDPTALARTPADLTDITACPVLDLDAPASKGWYYPLAESEKVLGETTVYYKVLYFSTFTPSTDACAPGGYAKLYALKYKTGCAAIDFDESVAGLERSLTIGTGIPSKPVFVIRDNAGSSGGSNVTILTSVSGTNPSDNSPSTGFGISDNDPVLPTSNFFYQWWKEKF